MPQNSSAPGWAARLLLVEDDPADRELIRRALQDGPVAVELVCASDGQEALDYLLRQGLYENSREARRPDLVLLDLNMPRLNGFQVLAQLRKYAELDRIPVVVLSAYRDVDRHARGLDAVSVLRKPPSVRELVSVLRTHC